GRSLRSSLATVLHHGREGEDLVAVMSGRTCAILETLRKPESPLTFVQDRPGHDRRYAVDTRKIQEGLGRAPQTSFEVGLASTVPWYFTHRDWQDRVLTREYRSYYRRQYD